MPSPYPNRVKVNCTWYGKEKKIILSRLKTYKRHFCNRGCFNKWKRESGQWHPKKRTRKKVNCDYCNGKVVGIYKLTISENFLIILN